MDKSLQKKKKTIISFVSFISGIFIGLVIVWTIINNQKSNKLKEAKIEKGQFSPQKENDKKRVKGYKQRENCQFCQATNLLGLEEKDLPDLTVKERIGVINSLFVKSHTLFDKGIEYLETEWLEKSSREKMTLWHEYEGGKDEHIIILKKTDQK